MRPSKAVYAGMFKALSDETRLSILAFLCGGELSALHLLRNLKISQSTLSYHMKVLCEARLVNSRKDGTWTKYSIRPEGLGSLVRHLQKLQNTAEEAIPQSQLHAEE